MGPGKGSEVLDLRASDVLLGLGMPVTKAPGTGILFARDPDAIGKSGMPLPSVPDLPSTPWVSGSRERLCPE